MFAAVLPSIANPFTSHNRGEQPYDGSAARVMDLPPDSLATVDRLSVSQAMEEPAMIYSTPEFVHE